MLSLAVDIWINLFMSLENISLPSKFWEAPDWLSQKWSGKQPISNGGEENQIFHSSMLNVKQRISNGGEEN